jgi:hypothetical protein
MTSSGTTIPVLLPPAATVVSNVTLLGFAAIFSAHLSPVGARRQGGKGRYVPPLSHRRATNSGLIGRPPAQSIRTPSGATGANIEALAVERGHRTLVVTRKGGKVVTIPLAPRTARATDLAIGERIEGPIFLTPDGGRLDRYSAGRIVRPAARRAGIGKLIGPHTLRHAFITAALDAGVPLRDVQEAASIRIG